MRLDQILSPIEDELKAVEKELLRWADDEEELVSAELARVVSAGGKRIRPACLLLASKLGPDSGAAERAIELAAAVEIIHTASLIHDDIVDRSSLRRGQPTLHARHSIEIALLVGDLLYSRVLSQLTAHAKRAAFQVVAETVHKMVSGELAETLRRDDTAVDEGGYLRMVSEKTGALFACATYLGAQACGLSEEQCERMRRYGEHLGVGFQIVDDVLDVCEVEDALGKPAHADISDGKLTLPLIHAMTVDRGRGSEAVCELFRGRDVDALRAALRRYGSLAYAVDKAEEYAQKAIACVRGVGGPVCSDETARCRRSLIDMAHYVVSRGRGTLERDPARPPKRSSARVG